MARILLVDDHPLFSRGFLHLVSAMRPGWRPCAVGSAREALAVCAETGHDLAVVDIGLPDGDGFALAAELERAAKLPVLLISGRDDPATRARARASGARGLVAKTLAPEALIERIDRVLAGGSAFDDAAVDLPALTARQIDVLHLLAAGHGNKEIRYRLGIAERTVRAHLTELFTALGVGSRMQAVIRARELGLIG